MNDDLKPANTSKNPTCRGRKATSGNVRLRPVFREEPDIEKLGRAIIAMAVRATNMETDNETGKPYEKHEQTQQLP